MVGKTEKVTGTHQNTGKVSSSVSVSCMLTMPFEPTVVKVCSEGLILTFIRFTHEFWAYFCTCHIYDSCGVKEFQIACIFVPFNAFSFDCILL